MSDDVGLITRHDLLCHISVWLFPAVPTRIWSSLLLDQIPEGVCQAQQESSDDWTSLSYTDVVDVVERGVVGKELCCQCLAVLENEAYVEDGRVAT